MVLGAGNTFEKILSIIQTVSPYFKSYASVNRKDDRCVC
jgi:hypothetical protein